MHRNTDIQMKKKAKVTAHKTDTEIAIKKTYKRDSRNILGHIHKSRLGQRHLPSRTHPSGKIHKHRQKDVEKKILKHHKQTRNTRSNTRTDVKPNPSFRVTRALKPLK